MTATKLAAILKEQGLPVRTVSECTEDEDATVYLTERVHAQISEGGGTFYTLNIDAPPSEEDDFWTWTGKEYASVTDDLIADLRAAIKDPDAYIASFPD